MMTRRRSIAVVAVVTGAALLLALVIGQRRYAMRALEARLAAADLPPDLARHLDQLDSLLLPAGIDSFGWLGDGLTELSVSQLGTADLPRLPRTLRSLEVRDYSQLESLDDLPRALERLTMQHATIRHLGHLPASLEEIELDGVQDLQLEAFPPGSVRVEIGGSRVRDLFGLPRAVSVLGLSGRGIEGLDGIPEDIDAVSLKSTAVDTLDPLPATLHALELVDNPLLNPLRVTDLPRFLVELSTEEQDLRELEALPKTLRLLRVRGGRVGRDLVAKLPATLVELELDGIGGPTLCSLPAELKTLRLRNAREVNIGCLPPGLEDLYLEEADAATLQTLNRRLKNLGIIGPFDAGLADLPPTVYPTLELLDLSFTGSIDLSFLANAPSLRTLVFRSSPLEQVRDLPVGLEVLDLSGSIHLRSLGALHERAPKLRILNLSHTRVTSTAGLPQSLRNLNLAGTLIDDLSDLPRDIEQLSLPIGRVRTLQGLPRSVTTLAFIGTK